MTDDREREDLANLVKHPGFQRFAAYARKEWSDEIARHLETSVNDPNDVMALNKMRQILAAKKAVDRLLAWPDERIKTIERLTNPRATAEYQLGRGGY